MKTMLSKCDLHEYQRKAVEFVVEHEYCGLFMQMGLGKTVSTLTAIRELMDSLEVERVLVVAPKKVAESTWTDEVARWQHLRGMETSIILGDKKRREAALEKEADVYVTSRDNFVWLTEQYTGARGQPLKSKPWPYDMVVIDELTSFKSSDSKRFKAFRRLRPYMHRVVGLTGTPTPNGLKDLWGQMYCIDMGRSLGHSKKQFMDAYFTVYEVNNVPIRITPKPFAKEAITKALRGCVLTMKTEDYLKMPPLLVRDVEVELSPGVMAQYREFEEECVLAFDEEQEPVAVAANAAVLAGKLLQYCNGAIYADGQSDDAMNGVWVTLHDEKLRKAMGVIESAHEEGESVLVMYEFKHDMERIIAEASEIKGLRVAKYHDEKELRAWNEGKIDLLLAHPASTAYGLNMQRGGHILLWYGTGWNAELYEQGNARLFRQGQTEPTIIYRLYCKDTMDERALRAVEGKINTQTAMIDGLREIKQQLKNSDYERTEKDLRHPGRGGCKHGRRNGTYRD